MNESEKGKWIESKSEKPKWKIETLFPAGWPVQIQNLEMAIKTAKVHTCIHFSIWAFDFNLINIIHIIGTAGALVVITV